MPATTPNRGYEYPCYSDLVNFPAQLQTFAEDVDADVQAIIDNIDDARNLPPSVRVSDTTPIAMPAGVQTLLTYAVEEYDNAAMFPGAGSVVTVPVEGMYLVSCRAVFPSGSAGQKNLLIAVSGGIRASQTRQANVGFNITMNVHALLFVPALGTIQTAAESSTLSSVTTRTLTVTRVTGATAL